MEDSIAQDSGVPLLSGDFRETEDLHRSALATQG